MHTSPIQKVLHAMKVIENACPPCAELPKGHPIRKMALYVSAAILFFAAGEKADAGLIVRDTIGPDSTATDPGVAHDSYFDTDHSAVFGPVLIEFNPSQELRLDSIELVLTGYKRNASGPLDVSGITFDVHAFHSFQDADANPLGGFAVLNLGSIGTTASPFGTNYPFPDDLSVSFPTFLDKHTGLSSLGLSAGPTDPVWLSLVYNSSLTNSGRVGIVDSTIAGPNDWGRDEATNAIFFEHIGTVGARLEGIPVEAVPEADQTYFLLAVGAAAFLAQRRSRKTEGRKIHPQRGNRPDERPGVH